MNLTFAPIDPDHLVTAGGTILILLYLLFRQLKKADEREKETLKIIVEVSKALASLKTLLEEHLRSKR